MMEVDKFKEKEKQTGMKEQELAKQVDALRIQHRQAIQDLDSKSLEV